VMSEKSDVSRRIESLTRLLRQRKAEADKLRRRQDKMKLKAKEESLRQQIEVMTRCHVHCLCPRPKNVATTVERLTFNASNET